MATQTITVLNPNLPVVQGIPFKPTDNLLSKNAFRVKDPNGNVVADGSAFEVLTRKGGLKTDNTKAIWNALVGFKPTIAGDYVIDDSGAAFTPAPLTVTNGSNDIRVQAGGVDVTINKTAVDLLSSFKVGAAEQLHASNKPRLRVPVTIFAGRSKLTANAPTGQNQVVVADGAAFTVGQVVKPYWSSTVTAYYPVDGTGKPVIVTPDKYGYYEVTLNAADRVFVVDRLGTPNIVNADYVDPTTSQGQIYLVNPAPSVAPVAGQTIEDKTLLDDVAANGNYTISAISGNTITLNRNLSVALINGTTLELATGATTTNTTADFTPETTIVERQLDQHVVIRQRGHFKASATTIFPSIEVTLRYHFYKDAGFIKVVPRFRNFSANNAVSAVDATFDQLFMLVPTATAGTGTDLVTSNATATTRDQANTTTGTIAAGNFKLSVPKFSSNFPKGLNGDAAGLRFDIFPNTGTSHTFPRDRADRSIFFLGENADIAANGIGYKLNARLNPAHVVATGLYRLATSVKPATPYTAGQLGGDAELAQAANTAEKLLSVAHDLSVAEAYPGGTRPAQTIREFRNAAEYYPSYGWKNFGIIPWQDNERTYNHYDTQLHLFTDWLRGAADTAFERGAECAIKMADFGTFQSRFLLNNSQYVQYQGINFYENDNRRTDPADGRPNGFPSHDWSGGLWTYWALTGDEDTHESVMMNLQSVDETGTPVAGRLRLYDWGPAGGGTHPGAWYGNTTSGSFDIFESNDGARWVGWAILNLIDAYRFNGDVTDLNKAAQYISCFVQSEIAQGSKGSYNAASMASADPTPTPIDNAPGSFIWAGYCTLGIIEYWRLTGDATIQAFLLRVADHLMKGDATSSTKTMNALLQGGDVWAENGNKYRPTDAIYRFWQGAETTFQSAGAGVINVGNGSKLLGPGSPTEAVTYGVISNGTQREVFSYTGRTGDQLTGVVRGLFGTTQIAWPAGTPLGAGAFTDGFGAARATGTLTDIFLPLLSTTARISGRSDLANMAKRIFKDIGLYRGVPGPFIDTTVATNRVYVNFRAYGAGGSSNKTFGQTAFAISQYFGDVLNNPTPVLTSLSPSSATAGASGATVSIVGTGLLASSVAKVNGVARNTTFVDSTHLIVDLLAGDVASAGTLQITVENPAPGGGTSNALPFTVNAPVGNAPTISSVSPNTATVNVATGAITITGTNLTGAAVTVAGASVTPSSISATQIVLPAQTFASTGAKQIVVTTGNGSANTTITVNNPAPTISSIAPTSAIAGAAQLTLTVNGSGFVSGSVVRWNGSDLATTFVSSAQLTAIIPANVLTTAGSVNVTVFNATPGGGTSSAVTFTINNITPPPTGPEILSVTPAALTQGLAASITIAGTNFTGASVTFNGVAVTPSSVSASQIIVTIPAQNTAGTYALVVTTNGGSASQNITVNALPAPAISSLVPPNVTPGSPGFTLAVIGANFTSQSVINIGGVARTTNFVSANRLETAIQANEVATATTLAVTVTTPGAGTSASTSLPVVVIPANLPKLRAGMRPAKAELRVSQGKTFQVTRQLKTSDGVLFDLTGVTMRLQVRRRPADEEVGIQPLLDLTTENGGIVIDVLQGAFTINMSAADTTNLRFATARFELEATSPQGIVVALLEGTVRIKREFVR